IALFLPSGAASGPHPCTPVHHVFFAGMVVVVWKIVRRVLLSPYFPTPDVAQFQVLRDIIKSASRVFFVLHRLSPCIVYPMKSAAQVLRRRAGFQLCFQPVPANSGSSKKPSHTSCVNSWQGGMTAYPYVGTMRATFMTILSMMDMHATTEK